MSVQFSSSETDSLEKQIENLSVQLETRAEDIDDVYEIENCVTWIKENDFRKVRASCAFIRQYKTNVF